MSFKCLSSVRDDFDQNFLAVLLLSGFLPVSPTLRHSERFLGQHTLAQIFGACSDFLCNKGGHDDDARLDQRQGFRMLMLKPLFS